MLLNDKQLKSLVKKTQKKCEKLAKARELAKKKINPLSTIDEELNSEVFDEMNTLPFQE